MAEVLGILTAIYTGAGILGDIASYTSKWGLLSDRLFDIKEGLDVAELTLQSWQKKYDIQDRRPLIYMDVLFGRLGRERIQQTLGSIKIFSKTIETDINKVVSRALLASPSSRRRAPLESSDRYDKELVQESLRKIKTNTSWSRKFKYSVLGHADDLEMRLECLHRKLGMLERFSDHYLLLEHPEIFSTIKRLPGRRVILSISDTLAHSTIQEKLLAALRARKDAELLHKASNPQDLTNRIHIGISVPQIHKRDFAFLLHLNGPGQTTEVLIHPVKIRAIHDRTRVPSEISSAIPNLLRDGNEKCYMLPSSSRSDGFQISIPPQNLLADLQYRNPLSTHIRHHTSPTQNLLAHLAPQDQIGIAVAISQGSFRLIGSQWLEFLEARNIRWRRSSGDSGKWTCMLAATPGDASTKHTFSKLLQTAALQQRRDRDTRDLSKHIHIFRIGLLLTELALKTPISYIDTNYSPHNQTSSLKVFIPGIGEEGASLSAMEIAAAVDMKTNVLLGNMVFECLNVLMEGKGEEGEVEGSFYREVVRVSEELEGVCFGRGERRRGGSGVSTPV